VTFRMDIKKMLFIMSRHGCIDSVERDWSAEFGRDNYLSEKMLYALKQGHDLHFFRDKRVTNSLIVTKVKGPCLIIFP
jgi:hypothetical protein